MENIVAHSLEKLYREFEKADQLFLDSGMKDMDESTSILMPSAVMLIELSVLPVSLESRDSRKSGEGA